MISVTMGHFVHAPIKYLLFHLFRDFKRLGPSQVAKQEHTYINLRRAPMFTHRFQAHTQHFVENISWFNGQRHANTFFHFKMEKKKTLKELLCNKKREKNGHNISERGETIIISAVVT